MAGRNDTCPCGSGRKYKKCCLDNDNDVRRKVDESDRFEARFFDAIEKVHREAVRHRGAAVLDRWSSQFQGGDLELEMDLFKAFTACHLPFEGAISLAVWVLQNADIEESERQLLQDTLSVPFSLWVVDEVGAGRAKVRDLLLDIRREVILPSQNAQSEPAQVIYGKVLPLGNTLHILSPGPVRIAEEAAQFVAQMTKGRRKTITALELLEPERQATLYLAWCSLFRRMMEADDDYDEPSDDSRLLPSTQHHRLRYSFDPRKRSWVVQALNAGTAFVQRDAQLFAYPGKGEAEAVIHVSADSLQVDATRVPHLQTLKQALEKTLGNLVKLQEQQSVNLMEHLLEHGVHSPLLPGMPTFAEAFSPTELKMLEDTLERLRASAESPIADEGDTLEALFQDYLEERAQSVSKTTLERDVREIEKLHEFLGYEATIDEFHTFFPVYLHIVHRKRSRAKKGETERTLASMRPLVEWLRELCCPDEFELLEEALLGPFKARPAVTYTFRFTLVDSQPKVWRDVRIPGRYRLNQVHQMLQILFGWKDYHLHNFEVGQRVYTDMRTHGPEYDMGERDERLPLAKALGTSQSLAYLYDFGDNWIVEATLLKTTPGDSDAPECLGGKMAGPPEDCGGIPGFENLKSALANPKDPDHLAMKRWAPRGYDPKAFSVEETSAKLVKKFGRKAAKPKTPKGED